MMMMMMMMLRLSSIIVTICNYYSMICLSTFNHQYVEDKQEHLDLDLKYALVVSPNEVVNPLKPGLAKGCDANINLIPQGVPERRESQKQPLFKTHGSSDLPVNSVNGMLLCS